LTTHYAFRDVAFVFERLCYLIAEGFEVVSITGGDPHESGVSTGRIIYRHSDARGRFALESEQFYVGPEELQACSNRFLDYLQSDGSN